MRRNAALLVMLAAEIGIAALALFFHLRSRPTILAAFREFDTALPATAAVALAPWFLPAALGFAAVASLVGLAAPLRRTRRAFLVGVGLMVAATALIFAVCAAFWPIFQPGGLGAEPGAAPGGAPIVRSVTPRGRPATRASCVALRSSSSR